MGISSDELTSCFVQFQALTHRVTLDDFRRCIDAKSTGAVRVSVGLASSFGDVYRFVSFVRGFLDRSASELAGDTDFAGMPE